MCILIVLRDMGPDHSVLVASNRDELRVRPASPPGLQVLERHLALAPKDKQAGGTWLGINDNGMFAGLTNISEPPPEEGRSSRGALPLLALDQENPSDAMAAVLEQVAKAAPNPFQLVVANRAEIQVLRFGPGQTGEPLVWPERFVVVTNEHAAGELVLPDLERALEPGRTANHRLDLLRPLLLDEGGRSGHRVLKVGGDYGTVSSSLIAVPDGDPQRLEWRYARGLPSEVPYANYGNLGRRLLPE